MEKRALIAELQRQIALCDDMVAYRKLYDRLHRELFLFSYSIIKSTEVAEEIVSDVFIKLWRIRNELLTIGNLTVFLYTIARNLSINHTMERICSFQRNVQEKFINLRYSLLPYLYATAWDVTSRGGF